MVAFVGQYQYNSDTASDRMQLQNMCKKGHESFKQYAQRWRDMAAQVAPPMMEKENNSRHITSVLLRKNGGVRTFKLCGFGLRW